MVRRSETRLPRMPLSKRLFDVFISLLLLALLAGLAAVARSVERWRVLEVPAHWRPAPYLALLERPG